MFIVAQANTAQSDTPDARASQRWSSQREDIFHSSRAFVQRITWRGTLDVAPIVRPAPIGKRVDIVAPRTSSKRDRFWPAAAQNGASMRAVRPQI